MAWFAAGRFRTRDIVLGQYLGIGALFAAGLLGPVLAWVVPGEHLRWLGVIPLAFGLKLLLAPQAPEEAPPPAAGVAVVAGVTLASGADNLGVYVPLFATSSTAALAVFAGTFVVMTGAWCQAARWLAHHPEAGAPLRKWGPRVVPWLLVALGVGILAGAL